MNKAVMVIMLLCLLAAVHTRSHSHKIEGTHDETQTTNNLNVDLEANGQTQVTGVQGPISPASMQPREIQPIPHNPGQAQNVGANIAPSGAPAQLPSQQGQAPVFDISDEVAEDLGIEDEELEDFEEGDEEPQPIDSVNQVNGQVVPSQTSRMSKRSDVNPQNSQVTEAFFVQDENTDEQIQEGLLEESQQQYEARLQEESQDQSQQSSQQRQGEGSTDVERLREQERQRQGNQLQDERAREQQRQRQQVEGNPATYTLTTTTSTVLPSSPASPTSTSTSTTDNSGTARRSPQYTQPPTSYLPSPNKNLSQNGIQCVQKCRQLGGISCKNWDGKAITCCNFVGCQWPFYCAKDKIIKVEGCVNKE